MGQGGRPGGTYHYAGHPATSWAGFARETFALAQRPVIVEDILTKDYPAAAARPLNSRLDCTGLQRDFGLQAPDWRRGLLQVLEELVT